MRSCQCFGGKVQRSASYVVRATPAHPEKPWAVGHEIQPGCLKVVAHAESKLLADVLAKRLATIHPGRRWRIDMKQKSHLTKWTVVPPTHAEAEAERNKVAEVVRAWAGRERVP